MELPSSLVGDVINFRGFVYAPLHAWGVYSLFSTVIRELRLQVEETFPHIPGCRARRRTPRGWEPVVVRCTVHSSEMRVHAADLASGSLLICWEDDWPECPVRVIELRPVIQRLTRVPALEPAAVLPLLQELEGALAVQSSRTRELFRVLDQRVRALSDAIEAKTIRGRNNAGGMSYYAPERHFLSVEFRKTGHGLTLNVYTRGHPLEGVNPGAACLWGYFSLRTEADLSKAVRIVKASYEAMQLALQHGEATSKSAKRKEAAEQRDWQGSA
jgi:hypothetical protein